MCKWLTISYWSYILDDSAADKEYGPFNTTPNWSWWRRLETSEGDYYRNPLAQFGNWIARCACRSRGHGKVFWTNLSGSLEPDMHCMDCGEDLG